MRIGFMIIDMENSSLGHKEFKVNEYITLKLENKKSNIYVGGELFLHCKHLLLLNPQENEIQDEIVSIDDAKSRLSSRLEREIKPKDLGITPEVEFWAHSSNLQAWVEHDYDTRLLEKNLVFGLLKRLVEANDPKALKVFKEEIAQRLFYNRDSEEIYDFLIWGYIKFLSNEEICDLLEEGGQELLALRNELGVDFRIGEKAQFKIEIRDGKIIDLQLNHLPLTALPEAIRNMKSLEYFQLWDNNLKEIPDWLGELENLKELEIVENPIKELPPKISGLRNLEFLKITESLLTKIPAEIGKLTKLKKLFLTRNQLDEISAKIGSLTNLKKLFLSRNQLDELPDIFKGLTSLEKLGVSGNNLEELPDSIWKLPMLKSLYIEGNHPSLYKALKIPAGTGLRIDITRPKQ